MGEFAYLARGPRPPPEQLQAYRDRWKAWLDELQEKGRLKLRGRALEHTGRLVKGKRSVTDGPFAEKDIIGGLLIVYAEDLDDAAALAAGCPAIGIGGVVEVRQVIARDP